MKRRRLGLFFLIILLGIGAGLLYGWFIMPAKTSSLEITDLRMDYKTDYILMVAEIYETDVDLQAAESKLISLGEDWQALIGESIKFAENIGYSQNDLDKMLNLSDAIKAPSVKQ